MDIHKILPYSALAALALTIPVASGASGIDVFASLKVLSGSSASADWYGEGAVTLRKALCITSTTGRYGLHVSFASGVFQTAPGNDPVRIQFTDETGTRDTKSITANGEIVFSGTTLHTSSDEPDGATCPEGGNATIEMMLPQSALTAFESGSYIDQISLFVQPT